MIKLSVIRFEEQKWNTLFTSVAFHQVLPVFDTKEVEELRGDEVSEEKANELLLSRLVRRVCAANQLAYYHQYPKEKRVIELIEPRKQGSPLTLRQLYRLIEAIEYNCIDNNGNDFLTADQGERLDDIKRQIAERIIYEIQ